MYTYFFKIRPFTDVQGDVSWLPTTSHKPQIWDSYSYTYVSLRLICRKSYEFKILIRDAQTLRSPYPALKTDGWMESELRTRIVISDYKFQISPGPVYTVQVRKETGSCGWMWPFGADFLQGGLQCQMATQTTITVLVPALQKDAASSNSFIT